MRTIRLAFFRSQFGVVPDTFTQAELLGKAFNDGSTVLKTPAGVEVTAANVTAGSVTQDVLDAAANVVETKPHFYAWATATTGMLAVARKQRSTFRNYVAAETAAPVIACAAGKGPLDEVRMNTTHFKPNLPTHEESACY